MEKKEEFSMTKHRSGLIAAVVCIAIIVIAAVKPANLSTTQDPTLTTETTTNPTTQIEQTTIENVGDAASEPAISELDFSIIAASETNPEPNVTTTTELVTDSHEEFISSDAQAVFDIISDGNQFKQESFSKIAEFLASNTSNNGEYKLKENISLVLQEDRSLKYLFKMTDTQIDFYSNVDVPDLMSPGKISSITVKYPYSEKDYSVAQVIGDLTFYDGSFYQFEEEKFSIENIPGLEDPCRVLGMYKNYIALKANNKIVLLQYQDGSFTGYYPIATTASVGQALETVYNESAVMVDRFIFYRSTSGKIVKLEINDDKTINETTVGQDQILVIQENSVFAVSEETIKTSPNAEISEIGKKLN